MSFDNRPTLRVGIDVGGTFTDLILSDSEHGTRAVKTFSTVSPTDGILDAVKKLGVPLSEVTTLVFGSTIATNALVEKKYSKVGILSTSGFRDTLEIRRIWREHLFGSFWQRPESMVPRKLRREVAGRMSVDGQELEPFDEAELLRETAFLVGQGVDSLAVSFLHAHVNKAHETRAKELLNEHFPSMSVSISSEESPEVGEYERLSTTVVAAALKPLISRELDRLVNELREAGFSGDIHVMKSNGGVMSVESAQRKPHELVQSGPSGGVAAARKWGHELGVSNIITLDVGGTTADISLIRDGKATVERQLELDWDIPVRVSLVDIRSVGAGGGSVAWVDAAGGPRLGPISAGSTPGPACFGRGGDKTTITDAAVLAGWLNPSNFAGGEFQLDVAKSEATMHAQGLPTALRASDLGHASAGILAIGVNIIAEQIRALTVKHGVDPRDFSLLVYGGGGGIFGADVAEAIGVDRVILPPNSSVLSAWGGLLADEEHDYSKTILRRVDAITGLDIEKIAHDMLAQARLDFTSDDFTTDFMLDLRYDGQTHVLTIPFTQPISDNSIVRAAEMFEQLHESRYGHHRPEDAIEITTLRLHAHKSLLGSTIQLDAAADFEQSSDAPQHAFRQVHRYPYSKSEWTIQNRQAIGPGYSHDGPLVLEDDTSTIMISEAWKVTVGAAGEINLTSKEKTQ